MRRIVLAAWIVIMMSLHGLVAQSIVFVSPSTKGLLTMSCAEGSLKSFEQLHYLATAHYLAQHLCQQPQIDGAVGVWNGQAENSSMIDGCPNERARELGALLAKILPSGEGAGFRPRRRRKDIAGKFSRQPTAGRDLDHDGAGESDRRHGDSARAR